MKRPFAASVWRVGDWYVAQCLELDFASQGETEAEALKISRKRWNSTSSRPRPHARRRFDLSRLRLARLNPEPFREVKRRLQAARFAEVSPKGSHIKFVRRVELIVDTVIVPRKHEIPVGTRRSNLQQAHISPDEWERF